MGLGVKFCLLCAGDIVVLSHCWDNVAPAGQRGSPGVETGVPDLMGLWHQEKDLSTFYVLTDLLCEGRDTFLCV